MDIGRFKNFAAAAVSDKLGSFGAMDPEINSMVPGSVMAGPAFTVRCYPGSIITVHKALLEANPGDVLVVDGEASKGGALLGEIMALQCKMNKFAGIVIDGCVRDLVGLRRQGFPVFARYVTPRVGVNPRLGQLGVPVNCGGVVVQPGDWIMGDDDGVVVIPKDQLEEIVDLAEKVEVREQEVLERVAKGEQVADILNMRDRIYPAG